MFMLCWTFFAVSISFILKVVILCVCVLFQAGHILHAFACFIYGSQSNKSLLIQTLVVLQNCGRKAIVITFVCTWLGNRQMTLIVSHCSQRLQHTDISQAWRCKIQNFIFIQSGYISMSYCSRAPESWLPPRSCEATTKQRYWILTSPVTTYLPSGEKESVVMVFLWNEREEGSI